MLTIGCTSCTTGVGALPSYGRIARPTIDGLGATKFPKLNGPDDLLPFPVAESASTHEKILVGASLLGGIALLIYVATSGRR